MLTSLDDIRRHLQPGFTDQQSDLLATCLYEYYQPIVHQREMEKIRRTLDEVAESEKRLAAAQERTEERMDRLVAAQERTEVRMDRLAASQEEMRDEIKDLVQVTKTLVWGQNDLRKQVGGIADSVGHGLEAYAMERIPALLEKQLGFVTQSAMPEILGLPGEATEIDVVCRGTLDGRRVVVLCEVKTNITETEVREFFQTVDRVRSVAGRGEVRMLFFGYRAGETARRLIAEYDGWLAFPRGLVVS